jgi:mono/diheme cytochrome c family protein
MTTRLAILILILLTAVAFSSLAQTNTTSFDREAFYKKNCVECHGAGAEKKFNPDLPEGQMVDAILTGVPMETPPDMPAFADKGINEERAKALIAYMKSLRQ